MEIGSEILEGKSVTMGNEGLGCWLILKLILLYILESNPRPFLQFQRAKKSNVD